MSAHSSGRRVRAKHGGVREEDLNVVYANADDLTDQNSGSQGATGDQGTQEHTDTDFLSLSPKYKCLQGTGHNVRPITIKNNNSSFRYFGSE